MGRHSSLPTLFDSALQLNIGKLKEFGYIVPGALHSGTLYWGQNGNRSASITITVDRHSEPYFKPYYNDCPTKRYIRINKNLREADQVSIEGYEKRLAGII